MSANFKRQAWLTAAICSAIFVGAELWLNSLRPYGINTFALIFSTVTFVICAVVTWMLYRSSRNT